MLLRNSFNKKGLYNKKGETSCLVFNKPCYFLAHLTALCVASLGSFGCVAALALLVVPFALQLLQDPDQVGVRRHLGLDARLFDLALCAGQQGAVHHHVLRHKAVHHHILRDKAAVDFYLIHPPPHLSHL